MIPPFLAFGALGVAARTAIKLSPLIAPTVAAAVAAATSKDENKDSDESTIVNAKTEENAVKNELRERTQRLQNNLSKFRILLDWTATDLGNKLDMSKQAISNLESKKTTLSVAQYIAIRALILEELIERKNQHFYNLINLIFNVLVENPDTYTDEQKQDMILKIDALVALKKANASDDVIINVFGDSLFNDQDQEVKDTIRFYESRENMVLRNVSAQMKKMDVDHHVDHFFKSSTSNSNEKIF